MMLKFGRLAVQGLLCVLSASVAAAQTGVSDDRVNLPDGPGSVDGFSDNAEVDENMGLMSYAVPLDLPQGHEQVTPELSLSYGSGTGNTALGMGWDLRTPFIERATLRGLPTYTTGDEFSVDGSDQLVELPGTSPPTYRSRFEQGFTRYRWQARGDGTEGYWTAEYPDGSIGYFGADRQGKIAAEARSSHPSKPGTFRYYLVEKVDQFGHVLRHRYGRSRAPGSRLPLLTRIEYVFDAAGKARYRVDFAYGARGDVVSDCKPGFCEDLADRLEIIDIFVGTTALRRYVLRYEDAGAAGLSRLVSVERHGSDGTPYEGVFRFEYSRSLGEQCSGCEEPYLVDMSKQGLGADIRGGYATLIDINGDALPDLLDTRGGTHTFYLNTLAADGSQSFATGYESTLSEVSGFELSVPNTQVLDVNGDGLADLANRVSQHYLVNDGGGDWASYEPVASGDESPDLSVDFQPGDAQLAHVRFLDYDNDKRIDLLRSLDAGGVTMFRNDGTGSFTIDPGAEDIGYGFDTGALQLSDMNGDGLLDPVRTLVDRIEFRLNLGFAKWGPWQGADIAISAGELTLVELEDLNGDQLSDVIIVQNDTLRYALNRNGAAFDEWVTLTSVGGRNLPTRGATTAILYADMNGNGSTDVVWADGNGLLTYLELFPVRPNLLTTIENGLGAVTDVTYGTSVMHLARDGGSGAWAYRLSHPMVVVDAVDAWDRLSRTHELTEYRYHDGFYDGREKAFRGYARVEELLPADSVLDSQQGARVEQRFEVGATDPYRHGLLSSARTLSAEGAPIGEERHEHADCPLADVPKSGLAFAVRHLCEVASQSILQEGRPEAEWVTTREESSYDGFGEIVLHAKLGVVHYGPPEAKAACTPCERDASLFGAPCGKTCSGDEHYEETTYIHPGTATGDAWILGRPVVARSYGVQGGLASETRHRYDGKAFEGHAEGRLTKGLASQVLDRRSSDGEDFVAVTRHAFDAHGNVTATLDPNGSPDDEGGHRRVYAYDDYGLMLVRLEVLLEDDRGPYSLRRDLSYDPTFTQPSEATDWMLVRSGKVESPRDVTRYRYDVFGRTASIAVPGDQEGLPSRVFAYELADPVSRVIVRERSKSGGELDLEQAHCIDGRGREVQRLTRLASKRYEVNGFTVYNRRGAAVRMYQPHTATTGACETDPPKGVLATALKYDAIGRPVETTLPDAAQHGTASVLRTVRRPLATLSYDAEDTDASSPHADTPVIEEEDGLGRPVAIRRVLTKGQASPPSTLLRYDGLGRLVEVEDAAGQIKRQGFDLLGRTLEVDDPNAGQSRFEHDAAGNLVRHEDARGEATVMEYDGANRLIARYRDKEPAATRVSLVYDVAQNCSACTNTEGQVASVEYPLGAGRGMGRDSFGYDLRGRTSYGARSLLGHEFALGYVYDNASRLLRTTYPDGSSLTRSYDGAARITAIEDVLDEVSYDARGLTSEIRYADGSVSSMRYDDVLRLAGLSTDSAGGELLEGYSYERDREGTLRTITDEADPTGDSSYRYDAWSRPTSTVVGSGKQAETLSFAFDATDNLKQLTSSLGAQSLAHVGDYTYEASRPSAVSRAGARRYAYDRAGRMTARGDARFVRDYQGRLTQAEGGAVNAWFAFGAGEERVLKSEGDSLTYYLTPDFEVRDGIATVYARIGKDRVARRASAALAAELLPDLAPEAEPDGVIRASDAWLALREERDDSTVGQTLRSAARRLLLETGPNLTFLHHDHLGSVTLATAEGELVGQNRFYPTGALRSIDGYVDAYGFTGQERDDSTELTHFRFRDLDTHTGRWASPDPLFETLSPEATQTLGEATTAYAYVANNFENAFDPDGLARFKDAYTKKQRTAAKTKFGVITKKNIMTFLARKKDTLWKAHFMGTFDKSAGNKNHRFYRALKYAVRKDKGLVKDILRPGGTHEMLMVSRVRRLHKLGIKVGEIQKWTIPTKSTDFYNKTTLLTSNHNTDKSGSAYAHQEIASIIDNATTAANLRTDLKAWQNGTGTGNWQLTPTTLSLLPAQFQ